MFDFLFKRKSKSVNPAPDSRMQAAAPPAQDLKKQQTEQARNAALAQLEGISRDEAAVVSFLLACDFADGRLKAAQYIHTETGLNQALAAMRNADRRVAKLMQSRLDLIQLAGKQLAAAQACIAAARQLALEPHLLANQVVELDRQAAGLKEAPTELMQEFDALRQKLETKLQAQTALQRQVLNLIARLHELADSDTSQAELTQQALAKLQGEFDDSMAQAEAVSLPRNLAQEFAGEIADLRKTVDAQLDALRKQAEEQARSEKRAADKAATIADAAATLAAQAAVEFPSESDPAPGVVSGEAVPAEEMRAGPVHAVKEKPTLIIVAAEKIIASIKGIEDALEQGSVQTALKLDRELRNVDLKASGLPTAQRDRLMRVRSELGHLQGWAKWGWWSVPR